jgi:phosphoribosylformylglycinamidine synthase subunit PurS
MSKKTRLFVTIKPDVLDPAGTSVKNLLKRQGFDMVQDVRIGKLIDITMSHEKCLGIDENMMQEIKKILSNDLVEDCIVCGVDEP